MFNKINRNNNDYINKMNKQVNQNNPINNRDDIGIKIIIASEVIEFFKELVKSSKRHIQDN